MVFSITMFIASAAVLTASSMYLARYVQEDNSHRKTPLQGAPRTATAVN